MSHSNKTACSKKYQHRDGHGLCC